MESIKKVMLLALLGVVLLPVSMQAMESGVTREEVEALMASMAKQKERARSDYGKLKEKLTKVNQKLSDQATQLSNLPENISDKIVGFNTDILRLTQENNLLTQEIETLLSQAGLEGSFVQSVKKKLSTVEAGTLAQPSPVVVAGKSPTSPQVVAEKVGGEQVTLQEQVQMLQTNAVPKFEEVIKEMQAFFGEDIVSPSEIKKESEAKDWQARLEGVRDLVESAA